MKSAWKLGLDLGSVHVKSYAIGPKEERFEWNQRAKGRPLETLADLLVNQVRASIGDSPVRVAVTGIGQELLGDQPELGFVNEVMATARAAAHLHPGLRTVIDIGGQFSKWILVAGSGPKPHEVRDFATNGLCAAGTGAFLDQQANRLNLDVETLGTIASSASKGAPIAGRCTVFAKSDMIHLQQKGTPADELAYGLCLALARTFLGTVMSGRKLILPVLLAGGGAANPGLVRAFRELLGATEAVVVAEKPLSLGSLGAALNADDAPVTRVEALARAIGSRAEAPVVSTTAVLEPLDGVCCDESSGSTEDPEPIPGPVRAYLGIDVGSVSTKLVLLSPRAELLQGLYLATRGEPLKALDEGLSRIRARYGNRLAVLGVGVTGSGRHLAARVIGADLVRNEITAQLTSAAHYFPDVDTVLELGGQDSKYIEAQNGRLLDFEMNKLCSAGTGSFLEEQARRLGIGIEDEFTKLARASASPCDLGTRCTVFMDSELVRLMQQKAALEDLCAGLAYSVARNYLEKVVSRRPIGRTVVLQGGTASNGAVVAAFGRILGRALHVHPYNRLSGALGAALLVQHQREGQVDKTGFFGLEACHDVRAESFECDGCENCCQVNRVTVSDRTAHFGDLCERYTQKDGHTREGSREPVARCGVPDLFAQRAQLLEETIQASSCEGGEKERIGIPRASLALEFLPFWVSLVSELGFEPFVSPRRTSAHLGKAARGVPAEVCLPLKAAASCIAELIQGDNVERLFVPSLLECLPRRDEGEAHTCLYAQQLPDMLRSEFGDRLILAQFAFGTRPWEELEGSRALSRAFDKPLPKVHLAMERARKVYERFTRAREELGQEALEGNFDRAVVVLGKPYNTHDPGLNLSLARHLRRLGLAAIPWDCLPLSQSRLSQRWETLPWHYNREQLRALELIRADARLFPLLVSNYGCGPDAFTIKHLEELLSDRPRLFLEFDEHRGDAGLVTRLEAFADEIEAHLALGAAAAPAPRETKGPSPRPRGERLSIPNFSAHAHIYEAVFRSAGLEAHVLPAPDQETVRLGEELSSGRECHPFSIILGEFVKRARSSERRNGDVFFFPSMVTPCLLRQYGDAYRIIARRARLSDFEIWDATASKLGKVVGMSGLLRLYEGLTAIDLLFALATRLRPYESARGKTEALFAEATAAVASAIAERRAAEPELRNAVAALMAMPRKGNPGDRPVIGVTGDLYTRVNPVGNAGLFARLEAMGCEVWPSPYFAASTELTAWRDSRREAKRLRLSSAFWETVSLGLAAGVSRRLLLRIAPEALKLAAEPKPSRLVALAEPFLSERANWMVLVGVGKLADFAERGAHGVISAAGVHCMVGVAIEAALPLLRSRYPEVPMSSLTYGGTEGPAQRIRLETFVHSVLERSRPACPPRIGAWPFKA